MEKECKECKHRLNEECYPKRDWINCCLLGNHQYSEVVCECGHEYCYSCAGSNGENPYNGGCYKSCPKCGVIIWDRPWELE